MKKLILLACVIAALAGAAAATGASQLWFDKTMPSYRCTGNAVSALCNLKNSGGYAVMVHHGSGVTIFRNREPIFNCRPYESEYDCADFR